MFLGTVRSESLTPGAVAMVYRVLSNRTISVNTKGLVFCADLTLFAHLDSSLHYSYRHAPYGHNLADIDFLCAFTQFPGLFRLSLVAIARFRLYVQADSYRFISMVERALFELTTRVRTKVPVKSSRLLKRTLPVLGSLHDSLSCRW